MPAAETKHNLRVMVGRQPILDRKRKVLGYELLFRATDGQAAVSPSDKEGAQLGAHLIADGVLSLGLDKLTYGRPAFVELTPEFLRHDLAKILPAERVVLQLPCGTMADQATEEVCGELRQQGYRFAITGYTPDHAGLLPNAAYAKIDVGPDPIADGSIPGTPAGKTSFIANGVNAVADFERASKAGFSHFQGFFFEKPTTLQAKPLPRGQIGYLRLLCALNDQNLSLQDLEDLVKRDASLCYRMLRTVNSAGFAQSREVTSIRHALLLLGRDTLRRWASLWVLADLGAEAPAELTMMASLRGRFCEVLAGFYGPEAAGEGFLLGMCSCLDVILQRPMESLVQELPISTDTIGALLGRDNRPRRLLDCVMAYERGSWEDALQLADGLGLARSFLPVAHSDALTWVHNLRHHQRSMTRMN